MYIYIYIYIYIYRMSGENINFDGEKIKKSSFYKNKILFNINDIDVNTILTSKREPYHSPKVSNYGVFSGQYFPAFGLNMERYGVSLRI